MNCVELLDGGRRVRFTLATGEKHELSARWLFDHADGARDPVSGQRRHGALEMEDAATAARIDGDQLILGFASGERRIAIAKLCALNDAPAARELWLTPGPIAAGRPALRD